MNCKEHGEVEGAHIGSMSVVCPLCLEILKAQGMADLTPGELTMIEALALRGPFSIGASVPIASEGGVRERVLRV